MKVYIKIKLFKTILLPLFSLYRQTYRFRAFVYKKEKWWKPAKIYSLFDIDYFYEKTYKDHYFKQIAEKVNKLSEKEIIRIIEKEESIINYNFKRPVKVSDLKGSLSLVKEDRK